METFPESNPRNFLSRMSGVIARKLECPSKQSGCPLLIFIDESPFMYIFV
jgi:hypothetical protein